MDEKKKGDSDVLCFLVDFFAVVLCFALLCYAVLCCAVLCRAV